MVKKSKYKGFEIKDKKMIDVFEQVEDYARHGRSCVLFGPTGTGKQYLAEYYFETIKENISRKAKMYSLNCSGLSSELAQSDLFGHVKGAFTGATKDRDGIFVQAQDGVVFLDEIGDLEQQVQAMLLKAIDHGAGEIRKVGKNESEKIRDVYFIGATEKPKKETLRESLLFRLGFQVSVPSLAERPEDVPSACEFFIQKSFLKRTDISELVKKWFNIEASKKEEIEKLSEISKLANKINEFVYPHVKNLKWSGNFRALREAIDNATIRVKKLDSTEEFIMDFHDYFLNHVEIYSSRSKENTKTDDNPENKSRWNDIVKKTFPNHTLEKKQKIAAFLADFENRSFLVSDFQFYMGDLVDKRAYQGWLKDLSNKDILSCKKVGQRNIYTINEQDTAEVQYFKTTGFLELPKLNSESDALKEQQNIVQDILSNTGSIFISGKTGTTRKHFIYSVASQAKLDKPVYYFSFKQNLISDLLIQIVDELYDQKIVNLKDLVNKRELIISAISGYLVPLFKSQTRPMFILDYIEHLKYQEDLSALNIMVGFWKQIDFALVGHKGFTDNNLDHLCNLVEFTV